MLRLSIIGIAGLLVLGAVSGSPKNETSLRITAPDAAYDSLEVPRRATDAFISPALTPISSHVQRPAVIAYAVVDDRLDPDDCFGCHEDDSMTMDRDGVEVSLFVDSGLYNESPHGGLDCLDCHEGFDPWEEPHLEEIVPVDCATCHDDAVKDHARSRHAGEANCSSCHGDVHVPAPPFVAETQCATCHETAASNLAMSVHATGEYAPSCQDCHAPHRFEASAAATCLSCHGDEAFVAAHIEGEDLEAVLAYENSIHGELIECADCHASHLVYPIDDPRSVVSRKNVASTCAECHGDVAEHYGQSEHAKALATNFAQAPTCTDCHGEHDIHEIEDAESKMSRAHEVEACLNCHLDSPEVQERMTHTSAFVASYEWSVHGRAAASGNLEAAICSDCHGAHDAMKATNPDALINKFNISETCGSCHNEILEAFESSIHGEALAEGIGDAPTCTTCHSEHEILKTADSQSPVAVINVSEQVCAPCHESFKLSEKYGFPSDRTGSFADSYHGLAGRFGDAESANCSSCHGVHNILPSTDPRSQVHPANLGATCGSCHPGANANFTKGSVHVIRTPEGDQLLYWIGTIYFLVIVVTIGVMTAHNTLDWIRKAINRYRANIGGGAAQPVHRFGTKLYTRMTVSERIQHIVLASSFMLLVVTGFMLKYPDAWWVEGLRDVLGQSLFEARGILHRVAAVVMVADGLYHLYYITFTKRGRRIAKDIWLRTKDWKDLVQMVRYQLGLTESRPKFDRFNYIEKSEYWALMWGTVVMTLTGFVLWFENHFMSQYSKLFVDINETIHYYEAWLAFLAIVVWHFYYVIFNPDVYPMNFTWITGKMTEEEMAHEHPLELERIKEEAGEEEDTA